MLYALMFLEVDSFLISGETQVVNAECQSTLESSHHHSSRWSMKECTDVCFGYVMFDVPSASVYSGSHEQWEMIKHLHLYYILATGQVQQEDLSADSLDFPQNQSWKWHNYVSLIDWN